MSKKIAVLVFLSLFSFSLHSFAATVNDPDTQGKGKFSVGLEQNFVFDQDLKKENWFFLKNLNLPGVFALDYKKDFDPSTFEISNLNSTLVKVGYGILDNLDVFVKLGTVDGAIRQNYTGKYTIIIPGLGSVSDIIRNGNLKYELEGANFVYGAGLQGGYELGSGWIIGATAQYLRHESDYQASDFYHAGFAAMGSDVNVKASWQGKMTFQEWFVAPYIAKKIGNFTPYLGVRYSDLRIEDKSKTGMRDSFMDIVSAINGGTGPGEDISQESYKQTYKAKHNFGAFLGTNYNVDNELSLNAEAGFLDQYAVSFGGTYKFDTWQEAEGQVLPKTKLNFALEQEFIFDQNLKRNSYAMPKTYSMVFLPAVDMRERVEPTTLEIDKMSRTLLKVGYDILNNLGLFVKLGTVDGTIRESFGGALIVPGMGRFNIGGDTKYELEGANFIYGAGIEGQYEFDSGWVVGIDSQYLRHESSYTANSSMLYSFSMGGGGGLEGLYGGSTWQGKMIFQEWQVGPYVGKKIGHFMPYIGPRYSDLRILDKTIAGSEFPASSIMVLGGADLSESYKRKIRAENNVGGFAGVDFNINDRWQLNLETSFVDKYSVKFGGKLKF